MYESLNFIKSSSNNVFVHCFSGKGRSASFVIAYLMYKERKNFNEIYKYVKQKRTIISPNQFFIQQLKTLDNYFQKSKYNLKGLKGMNYTLIENWVNEH
jgi:protein-tyrosine phosphatase